MRNEKETKNGTDRKKLEKELTVILSQAKDYDWNEIDMLYHLRGAMARITGKLYNF